MSDESILKLGVDTTDAKRGEGDLDRLAAAGERAAKGASTMESAYASMGRALGALGLAATAAETIKLADSYTLITSRLKLVTDGSQELASVQQQLFAGAQRNNTPFAETVQLYQRLSLGATELGASQGQLIKLTDAVGAALRLSGSSAATASGGLLQLSQAFAGPLVQAQEFNSLVDAMPELLRAAAKNIEGTGGTIAGLRAKVLDGNLATKDFFEGILKGSDELIAKSGSMQVTVGQALTQLQNSFLSLVGAQNETTGATATLANGIVYLSQHLDTLLAITKGFGTAVLAKFFLESAQAVGTKVAATLADIEAMQAQRAATVAQAQAEVQAVAAKQANLAATQAGLVVAREEAVARLANANATVAASRAQIEAARSAGALSVAIAAVKQGEVQLAGAMSARSIAMAELAVLGQQQVRVSAEITAATVAQTAAQGALNAATSAGGVAASIGARALGLLGGPIGAIVTVLGLGVTAWQLWGSSATKAAEATEKHAESEKSAIDTARGFTAELEKQNKALADKIALMQRAGGQTAAVSAGQRELTGLYAEFYALVAEKGGTESEQNVRREKLRIVTEALGRAEGALADNTRLKSEADVLDGKTSAAVADIRNKVLNVNEKYVEQLKTLADAQAKGQITEEERIQLAQKLTDETYKLSKAQQAGTDAYRDAIAASNASVQAMRAEVEGAEKMTASEKALAKIQAEIDAGTLKLNRTLLEKTAAVLRGNAALERQLVISKQIREETQRTAQATADARRKESDAIDAYLRAEKEATEKSMQSLRDRIKGVELETAASKVAREQNVSLAQAIEMVTIARLEEKQTYFTREGSPAWKDLQAEIDKRKELLTVLKSKEAEDAATKSAKDAKEAWAHTVDSIYNGLTDSLYRAFESGKDFFGTFLDGIKNTLKTTVLKIAVQAVMSPIQQALGGLLNGSSGSGGGILGSLSNLGSLASNIGSLFGSGSNSIMPWGTGLSSMAASGIGALGSMFGSSTLGAFSTGMGLTSSQAAAAAAAYANAGMSGTGAAISAGASASSAIPIIGWIIAGMMQNAGDYKAGYNSDALKYTNPIAAPAKFVTDTLKLVGINEKWANILSGAPLLAKIFGPKWSQGGWANGTFTDKGFDQSNSMWVNFGHNTEKVQSDYLKTITDAIAGNVAAAAAGFGGKWTNGLRLGAYTDADREGLVAAKIGFFGNGSSEPIAGVSTGVGGFIPGMEGAQKMDAKELDKWISEQMPALIVQGLQGSDLPQRFKEFFGVLGKDLVTAESAKAMLETAQVVQNLTDALLPFGGVFAHLGDLSVQATANLTALTGGFDAFLSKTQSYVQSFYSESEQAAIQAAQINRVLVAAGVNTNALTTKEAFRSLVDSLDLKSTQGQTELAALLNSAQGFAGIAEFMTKNGLSLAQLAERTPGGALGSLTNADPIATIQPVVDSLTRLNVATDESAQSVTEAVEEGATATKAALDSQTTTLQEGFAAVTAAVNGLTSILKGMSDGDAILTRAAT